MSRCLLCGVACDFYFCSRWCSDMHADGARPTVEQLTEGFACADCGRGPAMHFGAVRCRRCYDAWCLLARVRIALRDFSWAVRRFVARWHDPEGRRAFECLYCRGVVLSHYRVSFCGTACAEAQFDDEQQWQSEENARYEPGGDRYVPRALRVVAAGDA